MIARIWHGYTTPADANDYETILKADILPSIKNVRGYLGSYLLRRLAGDEVEFVTILFQVYGIKSRQDRIRRVELVS